jgi:hypothetical protein
MSTPSHFKTCAARAGHLRSLLLVLTLLLVLPQSSAFAAPADASSLPPHRDPFALDLALATLVPVSVGPDLSVELPGRVLLQAHLGWMPDVYSRTLTRTLEDAGAYDEAVGTLIDGALQSSTTFHVGAGLRPFAKLGFELRLGYAYVALDGASSTGEIIPLVNAAVAERLNTELGDVGIDLDSHIHHLTLAAGWRWLIADRVVVRASLGYMQAFDSNSSLQIAGFPELTRLAAPTVEAELHDHYMRYIKIPTVGLSIGYRFF